MDNLMERPWFLRFTALALAIILFISVQAEEEKKGKSTVGDTVDIIPNVPVEVFYDNENLVVTGVPETVNVTIQGPVNLVQSAKYLKDFSLIVDLRNSRIGEHRVQIKTENLSDKLDVRLDPATVDVVIEEKITRPFKVEVELNERLVAEDYKVTKKEAQPSTIEVTGAKSVVESISFVKVSATGDKGINKSFEQKAKVRVLDRDLNKLNVTINPEDVTVKVEIEENSKEVPVVLKQRGAPGENITIDSIFTDTKTIKLFGPPKTLDAIKEFVVDVDVSTIKDSTTLELNLKKPRGVSRISVDKLKVNIAATNNSGEDSPPDVSVVEPTTPQDVTKEFKDVPVVVKGLDEKYSSTFRKPESGVMDVTVTANQDVINSLDISDLNLIVDASETDSEGEHVYPVSVEAPSNITWKLSQEEVTLEIKLA